MTATANSKIKLAITVEELDTEVIQYGVEINESKTKYMTVRRKHNQRT